MYWVPTPYWNHHGITGKFKNLSILCDVDMSSTSVYIEKENCELNTFKLPFGASNYISTDKKISEQFFERLGNSISSIVEKFGYPTTNQIFLSYEQKEMGLLRN